VKLGQKIAAQAVSDPAGIDAVVLSLGCRDGPTQTTRYVPSLIFDMSSIRECAPGQHFEADRDAVGPFALRTALVLP
jgi:hypothetical protein